jgi:uncharacterized protein YceK
MRKTLIALALIAGLAGCGEVRPSRNFARSSSAGFFASADMAPKRPGCNSCPVHHPATPQT